MNPSDTADVLAKAAAYDRRTVGETDVAAWHEAIGDLDRQDCLDAVAGHYRDSTDWLKPAHVRTRVSAVRTARLSAVPDPVPSIDPDDPVGYREELVARRAAIASGLGVPSVPMTIPRPELLG